MASVASSGASPLGTYDFDPLLTESASGTDDESWAFIDPSGSSNPGSITFFPSPSSLASYGIVGHPGQMQPSPPAPSPLNLDIEQVAAFSMPFTEQAPMSRPSDGAFLNSTRPQSAMSSHFIATPQQFLLDDQQFQGQTARTAVDGRKNPPRWNKN